jgi:hypothetical protein
MNYKIRITADNQAIVKRIADENGMNPNYFTFNEIGNYFFIFPDGKFREASSLCNGEEITTEQFIELFDKKETELGKWIKETKAKNLSLEKLKIYITNKSSCNDDLYKKLRIKLDIKYGISLAEFLFNQWNNPTKESPKVETESRKIIGYKAPCDMFGEYVSKGNIYVKLGQFDYGYYLEKYLHEDDETQNKYYLPNEIVETWEPVFEPLPIEQPKETDFKSKVIDLIEGKIEECKSLTKAALKNQHYDTASKYNNKHEMCEELLKQIKEL